MIDFAGDARWPFAAFLRCGELSGGVGTACHHTRHRGVRAIGQFVQEHWVDRRRGTQMRLSLICDIHCDIHSARRWRSLRSR